MGGCRGGKGPRLDAGGVYAERGRVEQSVGIPEAREGSIGVGYRGWTLIAVTHALSNPGADTDIIPRD